MKLLKTDSRGVMTVEASIVITAAILLIFSIIMLAVTLSRHSASMASVRRGIQEKWGSLIEEGKVLEMVCSEKEEYEISLWPHGSVSYEESARRIFCNMPALMRAGRIFREDE